MKLPNTWCIIFSTQNTTMLKDVVNEIPEEIEIYLLCIFRMVSWRREAKQWSFLLGK